MNGIEVIPQHVNLGKAATALGLERVILNNGILPNSPIQERASLVKGIITGFLDQGKWSEAVDKVCAPGGPVRTLFDGDWDGFKKAILESMKSSKGVYVDEKDLERLSQNWTPEELYSIAALPNAGPVSKRSIINRVYDNLPDHLKKPASILVAESYLEGTDDNYYGEKRDPVRAYTLLKKAGETEKADEIYDGLTKNLYDETNLPYILKIAEEVDDRELGNQRLKKIVLGFLEDSEIKKEQQYEKYTKAGKFFYELSRKRGLKLDEQQALTLEKLAAAHMDANDIVDNPDQRLRMFWALEHAKTRPALAYAILKEAGHKGPELLEAAKTGLRNRSRYYDYRDQWPNILDLDKVSEEHLRAVYPEMPLEFKTHIASHLKDAKEMQALSRQLYDAAQNDATGYGIESKSHRLEKSYQLWIDSGADINDPHLKAVRQATIDAYLKASHISSHWLRDSDADGHTQMFQLMLENNHLDSAYNIAKKLKDESLLSKAREAIIAGGPEKALDYFGDRGEKDTVGADLAITRIAEKYSVSKDALAGMIRHVEEERASGRH